MKRYRPKHKHVHEWTYRRTSICYTVRECRCGQWDLM